MLCQAVAEGGPWKAAQVATVVDLRQVRVQEEAGKAASAAQDQKQWLALQLR